MEPDKAHWSFWVICVIGLLWNAIGCANFIMQMNPDALGNYPEAARTLVESRPLWSTAAFAVAVFGGLLADVVLMLKNTYALPVFVVSLSGVAITNIHTFLVSTSPDILIGSGSSFVVGAFFIWYVSFCKKKLWLNQR